ncbi:MAG: hypothetical protein C1O27_002010 [Chloroflexi bacterium]|jgi:hypothetical protein|nr:MAG: hypothetical protein C1O27_002010 [Chloroflexota bacterium]
MRFFSSKETSDDDHWFEAVIPLFVVLRPYTKRLWDAVESGTPDEQVKTIREVIPEMVPVVLDFRSIPRPKSKRARKAWGKLDAACQDAIEGSRRAMQLYHELGADLGEGVGIGSKRAMTDLAYQKYMFENLLKAAEKGMQQAAAYFEVS